MARHLPSLLAGIGARLTRRAHTTRLGLDQKSREDPDSGGEARARHTGGLKNPGWRYMSVKSGARGVRVPVATAEHRRPRGREAQGVFGGSGGPFLYGRFSLGKQRKATCRGSVTRKQPLSSPEAIQKNYCNRAGIARCNSKPGSPLYVLSFVTGASMRRYSRG